MGTNVKSNQLNHRVQVGLTPPDAKPLHPREARVKATPMLTVMNLCKFTSWQIWYTTVGPNVVQGTNVYKANK